MRIAYGVVGANLGDEGKGLVTDFLAHQMGRASLVVRSNGGAQAGHTVVTPSGRRHVFSHFGSGSFVGCPTYLSRFFVTNPILYFKERAALREQGCEPRVMIDRNSLVTTPFDMMINQIIEQNRGSARHGSCGIGFGETIERNEKSALRLRVGDLKAPDLPDRLRAIHDEWLPKRLARLNIHDFAFIPEWKERLDDPQVIDEFVTLCRRLASDAEIVTDEVVRAAPAVLFEGAQGLLLDQDHANFPHVTRSYTGIRNMVAIAQSTGIRTLDVTYVSRAYLTRHGAGPLPNEMPRMPFYVADRTNVHNMWQGTLRYGLLDLDGLRRAMATDLQHGKGLRVTSQLALTCLDQVGSTVDVVENRLRTTMLTETFAEMAALRSYGETRRDVRSAALVAAA